MESLLLEQEEISTLIKKGFTNYKKTAKDKLTSIYINNRLEILEPLWTKFRENHFKIVNTLSKAERLQTPYFIEEWYDTVEETYSEYKCRLKLDMSKRSEIRDAPAISACNQSCNPAKPEVKLPQIQLPTFSGAYEEWQSFHDMFLSLIHNNDSLSAVQKMHYLKCGLRGEPAMLLRSITTTESNYTEAWDKLVKRYSNKRYNANEVMQKLFSLKSVNNKSATAIKNLLDTTAVCLKSLQNLGVETDKWDLIIHITVSKLDYETRSDWESEISRKETDDFPTWNELVTFLEKKFRTLELLSDSKSGRRFASSNEIKAHKSSTVQNEKSCVMCDKPHLLYQCKQFESKSPQERSEFIQSKRLCFNCFAHTHNVKNCHQPTSCRRCGRRHHTLLHLERSRPQEVTRASTSSTGTASNAVDAVLSHERETPKYEKKVVAHFANENYQKRNRVLLATALVRIKSQNGYYQRARVLIDQGSEASFVTESVVQSLGLKRTPVNSLVTGVGEGKIVSKSIVNFELESLHNCNFSLSINAFVLTSLTSFLPSCKAFILNWPDLHELPLADPYYGSPGKIDIILGVEGYSQILLSGLLKHPSPSGPIAQNTQLGWIISGNAGRTTAESTPRVVSCHLKSQEDSILKQFWEIEREPDVKEKKLTREEKQCEEIYETTTTRTIEGRYVVRLPFRDPDPQCMYGKSKEIAMKRFMFLERKLSRDLHLRHEYTKVINDYLEQNHMEEVTDKYEIENPYAVYLPHHAVVREDKETTKVRVVFDASCKGVNNVSLNETFLIGPRLQQDLRHILMRWRTHRFCIVADITQMYRQVAVNQEDADFQRIVWRDDSEKPIRHFRLLRLTFGTACAPYLAVKSLQQLAKDEQLKYPVAAKITLQDYYVDDLLTGCETEEEAIDIYKEINKLMEEGGFKLQKWCSNSKKLLSYIEKDDQNTKDTFVFKINDTIKVLGISWNKNLDKFEYTYNLPDVTQPITKRRVLSEVARLYDPMGWVAPILITAKIFIQKLWKSGLNWDDNLTSDLLKEWICFRKELNDIKSINLPRWMSTMHDDSVELHVFTDASQAAYAAVVYLKCRDKSGNTYVNIVTAKTKVAPVEKQITIPRLELCAALLGAKLLFEVSQILKISKENLFAWSDSTVVLAWLRGEPGRWTTFVSNRVSEILTILDYDHWNHISTDQNSADCASRGISVRELREHELWWHGPDILKGDIYCNKLDVNTDIEARPIKGLATSINPKEDFIWLRFSNLSRMLRVLSYCIKFLKIREPEAKSNKKLVTVNEMDEVLNRCLKATQELYFEEDIKNLKATGSVNKKNQLHTLSPIMDQNGVLRVGGRITQCSSSFDKKHPIILPSESHITKLIIKDAHQKTLHGGPQIMLNYLRSKYWIIKAREKVKKCYRECVICVRYSRQNNNQFMGQLPKVRLTPTKPFLTTGVDFTGHIDIRFSPGRGARSYKGYICLFICMATKAIHLEAVSDLTSSGFIAAFKRFISRRGRCQHMYSDNGTNFVGADKDLRELFNRAKSQLPDEIAHLLAEAGTTWHFIPPHAPNFGGLWEAGVRSTKTHLKRIIGNATLTFEELTTVLTQVEACLNSRPISFLSENPDDPMPLTPGHFLVGEPLVTIPEPDYTEMRLTGLQRWKLIQKMVNDFWRKWSDEYLVTLNHRYKWFTKRTEPEINDIVVIRDHNIPPARWLLGKIVEKHAGKDDVTRVVSVRIKNGICKRPCNKLCFLPKAE